MGFFGPSVVEVSLRQQLAQTQAELELTQVNEKRLLNIAESNRDTIDNLFRELGSNQIANRIAAYTLKVLKGMENNGEVNISAELVAREVVLGRYKDQVTASLANIILGKKRLQLIAEIDPTAIDTIREQLTETFTHDGTFAKLQSEVELDKRREIIEELLDKARAEAEAANNTPEALNALRALIQNDPEFRKLIEEIEDTARQKARRALEEEFKTLAPEIARDEVNASREERLIEFMKTWRNTPNGKARISYIQKELAEEVAKIGVENILAETKDETLTKLHAKREAQIARDLEAQVLTDDFLNGGIDTSAVPVDTRLELSLGHVTSEKDTFRNIYNYEVSLGNKETLVEERRIVLVAQVDGKFIVNSDSLAGSKSIYEQKAAIPTGTILHLGRKQINNGNIILDNRIAYGVPIFYDTDNTDDAINSTMLDVQAVKIGENLVTKPGIKAIKTVSGVSIDLTKSK